MKLRDLVIISIVLVAIYLFVGEKAAVYRRLIEKLVEWISTGVRVLTRGSVPQ
jgi:hypothetical protein